MAARRPSDDDGPVHVFDQTNGLGGPAPDPEPDDGRDGWSHGVPINPGAAL